MTLRRILPALALLIVLGLVAWRLVRKDSDAPAAARAATPPIAAAKAVASPGSDEPAPVEPTARPGEPSRATSAAAPSGSTTSSAPPSPSTAKQAAGATLPPAVDRPGEGSAKAAEKKSGDDQGLVDQTGGWGKNAAAQLNKELMPLANECIEQALARNPKLRGSLALDVTVAPMNDPLHKDKAIIEAMKEAPQNEIEDAELVECIRQSSFAMEGLEAPYNFTLWIPINLDTKDN